MARFVDPFYSNNFLDANVLNEIANGSEAAKEILRLSDEEGFTLILPYSVQAEVEDPKTPEAVKKASWQFIYSVKVELTAYEKTLYERLLAEATGESKPENIARDLFHVFEASKYGGGHFVTRDKRLIKRGNAIAVLLGVELLTPEDFIAKVKEGKA